MMTKSASTYLNDLKKTSKNRDFYRPHFCSSDFYVQNQSYFKTIFHEVRHLSQKNQIVLWVISLTALRRPNNWYSGQAPIYKPAVSNTKLTAQNDIFSIYELFQKIQIKWPRKINPNISLYDFINQIKISPLPASAQIALHRFFTGQYPLEILCYEPNPLELLKIQMTYKRVLTFESDYENWPTKMYGHRDPLSFWIHDLIHADHFFRDPSLLEQQVGFYHFVYEILAQGWLDDLLISNDFERDFSYLISDMNSHPVHLAKTLHAHIEIHSQRLNLKKDWKNLVNFLSENRMINEFERDLLLKVNTKGFNDDDAHSLTEMFHRHTKTAQDPVIL